MRARVRAHILQRNQARGNDLIRDHGATEFYFPRSAYYGTVRSIEIEHGCVLNADLEDNPISVYPVTRSFHFFFSSSFSTFFLSSILHFPLQLIIYCKTSFFFVSSFTYFSFISSSSSSFPFFFFHLPLSSSLSKVDQNILKISIDFYFVFSPRPFFPLV